MLKYTYEVNENYKVLRVFRDGEEKALAIIMYFFGFYYTIPSTRTTILRPMSIEEIDEVNKVLKKRGMQEI